MQRSPKILELQKSSKLQKWRQIIQNPVKIAKMW